MVHDRCHAARHDQTMRLAVLRRAEESAWAGARVCASRRCDRCRETSNVTNLENVLVEILASSPSTTLYPKRQLSRQVLWVPPTTSSPQPGTQSEASCSVASVACRTRLRSLQTQVPQLLHQRPSALPFRLWWKFQSLGNSRVSHGSHTPNRGGVAADATRPPFLLAAIPT